jgi:catechol 2,3-dioxygenase-like lactoylglutathione lyase family enzyme
MGLVNGINHVAFVTADLDRLAEFYKRIFDANVVVDFTEGPMRHAGIEIGPDCVLHAFEFADSEWAKPGQLMFRRGRLDHIAINASSQRAWDTIRERLISYGAADAVTDFGGMLSFFFTDPDGMEAEVCVMKEGKTWADMGTPADFQPRHPLPEA